MIYEVLFLRNLILFKMGAPYDDSDVQIARFQEESDRLASKFAGLRTVYWPNDPKITDQDHRFRQ